jgi:hypothetical protein
MSLMLGSIHCILIILVKSLFFDYGQQVEEEMHLTIPYILPSMTGSVFIVGHTTASLILS